MKMTELPPLKVYPYTLSVLVETAIFLYVDVTVSIQERQGQIITGRRERYKLSMQLASSGKATHSVAG